MALPTTADGKKAGAKLYMHHELNRNELFSAVEQVAGDMLMTYDFADEVLALVVEHDFQTRTVTMMNTHHAQMTELLIGRDLSWMQ